MSFNNNFLALKNEADFTKEILGIGVTQLYKANYSNKGIYYQSFVCLSTGLERILKLCLILDYYINNKGEFPSEKYITNYGHNIKSLFERCHKIKNEQAVNFHFKYVKNKQICEAIVDLLNEFSKTSGRYSNINIVTQTNKISNDCTNLWFNTVDLPIYNNHISTKKKQCIENNANIIGSFLNEFSFVHYISEDNKDLTDAMEASKRTDIWQAVAPYRQLYTLNIIRYLTEILIHLGHKAMIINNEDIPMFSEIFALFYNDNTFFRSRKTWDNL